MQLISSAQNQEDVMLWRSLRQVREGFYIDVGAADPFEYSVTRIFYDRGWRGINLEPSSTYFPALSNARPKDINLCVAVGRETTQRTFYHVAGTGLSTFDQQIALSHQARGWEVTEETIETLTLAEVCRRYRPCGPIHFLKIDVEGAEADVLAGADFGAFRPWIVLAEATVPLSQEPSYADWEPILTGQGYSFVWFDGLNRFYISDEMKGSLEEHFRVPPNIYDGFVQLSELAQRAEQADQRMRQAQAEAVQAAETVQEVMRATEETTRQTTAMLAEQSRQATETQQRVMRLEEQAADSVRRAVDAVQQIAAALAHQLALTAEAQRQNNDLIRQLADAQAQYATLAGDHERARAALSDAERRRDEGLASASQAHEAARKAEERLAWMRHSTSWRVTAPLRAVRRLLLPGVPGSVLRKETARRVFHRSAQLFLRLPGGRGSMRLTRRIAPRPVEWLALRYRAYEQSAAERQGAVPTAIGAGPLSAPAVDWPHRPSADVASVSDLSEEEARVYRQLAYGGFAAAATA